MSKGRIVRILSNLYTVSINEKKLDCQARGKFRNQKITPLVGDFCEVNIENKYILDILPRKNFMLRPMIANVDIGLIVTSLTKPNISYLLLDKLISVIIYHKIKPMICFTKKDLLESNELEEIEKVKNYYESIGIPVFYNDEIDLIKTSLKEKNVVVTGQTGAGKSTLLNHLNPNLELKTNPISKSLGRGIHTTRHTEIYDFEGIFIADTPGFSSLEINNFTKEELKSTFVEFQEYPCKFKDCSHVKEISCEVKKAVEDKLILKSRYDSYLAFLKEVEK